MRAIVLNTRGDVERLLRAVNAALGYPKDGVNIGGGRHAPPEVSRTRNYVDFRRHPKREEYAFPVDAVVEALHGLSVSTRDGFVTIDLTDVQDLPADWTPEDESV